MSPAAGRRPRVSRKAPRFTESVIREMAEGLRWPDDDFEGLRQADLARRGVLLEALRANGFGCETPEGAYSLMCDLSGFLRPGEDDVAFALRLGARAGGTGAC